MAYQPPHEKPDTNQELQTDAPSLSDGGDEKAALGSDKNQKTNDQTSRDSAAGTDGDDQPTQRGPNRLWEFFKCWKCHKSYLFLVRHGEVDRTKVGEPLTNKSFSTTATVARSVKEHLALPQNDNIRVGQMKHSPSLHAKQTAMVISGSLNLDQEMVVCDCNLSPEKAWLERKKRVSCICKEITSTLDKWSKEPESVKKKNAIILVGHEPQLGWISEKILGDPIPICRSEVVCLEWTRGWRAVLPGVNPWRVAWSAAPSDPRTEKQLLEKIKAKMEAARLLGTFITLLLPIVLGILTDGTNFTHVTKNTTRICFPWCLMNRAITGNFLGFNSANERLLGKGWNPYYMLLVVTVGLLLAAAVLYFTAMYQYDNLLMPKRFWASSLKDPPRWLPTRPPSSSTLVLYYSMLRIWNVIFTPATVLVIFSVVALAALVLHIDCLDFLSAIISLVLLLYFGSIRRGRSNLGIED